MVDPAPAPAPRQDDADAMFKMRKPTLSGVVPVLRHGDAAAQLHALAKDAAQRASIAASVAPELLYAPILWALQDAPAPRQDDATPTEKLRRMSVFLDGEEGMTAEQWFARLNAPAPRQDTEVVRLRAALADLIDYTNQLEMLVYAADDTGDHETVANARAVLANSGKEVTL